MKRRLSKEAFARLPEQLVAALADRPSTILELAEKFGCSHYTVRDRLRILLLEGEVHYVEVATKGNLGMAHIWHAGAAPPEQVQLITEIASARTGRPAGPIGSPRQETVHQYPVVGQRDPLVAALFGPGAAGAA